MSDEKFRKHFVDIRFQDNDKKVVFEYDDGEEVIGDIDLLRIEVDSDRFFSKEYLIIDTIEQLVEYIDKLPANTNDRNKKIISSCIFRNQNIIDEILKKYSDINIDFISCFFIFSETVIKLSFDSRSIICFKNCYFKGQLELTGTITVLSFTFCDFLGIVKLKSIKFSDIAVSHCIFNKGLLFPGKMESLRKHSLFHFEESIFKDIVQMRYYEYEPDISFNKSKFLKESNFDLMSKFLGRVLF